MVTGQCQCGEKSAVPIGTMDDLIRFASGHGHFPRRVKLACCCGSALGEFPNLSARFLNGLLAAPEEDQTDLFLKHASDSYQSCKRWIAEHAPHTGPVN